MILRSPTEHENADLCHAGMDSRHPGSLDASGDIHVTWIPALHAGMTQAKILVKLANTLQPVFSKKARRPRRLQKSCIDDFPLALTRGDGMSEERTWNSEDIRLRRFTVFLVLGDLLLGNLDTHAKRRCVPTP
jgi:hypothetical protein